MGRLKILFLIFVLMLASCGRDAGETGAGVPMPGEEEQKFGGEITIASYKPDTLCPIYTRNNANAQMLNIIYDSLVVCESNMTVSPRLARSFSQSESGLVWTIELINAKWHDGSYFTANDVVFTVNTIKADNGSVYAQNVENIAKISAQGADVVEITLNTRQPEFMNLLYFPIIKAQTSKIDKESYVPIGTGAFKFDGDSAQLNMYVLNRNNEWWGGRPYLDRINVKLLPDKETAVFSFASRDIDIANVIDVNWAGAINSADANVCMFDTNKYNFLGFNLRNDILSDINVRRAIKYAVDNNRIVNNILYWHGSVATMPVSPAWYLYDEALAPYEYSPDKAREILTDNGWTLDDNTKIFLKREGNKTLKLSFDLLTNNDNPIRELVANFIAQCLMEVGIEVKIRVVENREYTALINNRQFTMALATYDILNDMDLEFMLGGSNVWGYKDDEMDDILAYVRTQSTPEGMKHAYSFVQKKCDADIPMVGLYFKKDTLLYSKRIKGELTPVQNNIYHGIDKIYL